MYDMLFSNYCLWSHLVWNELCLCEMPCYFQSVPFNKLALCRKGGLIIPYMILICINRKCPFVCLLKGVCFIICSLLEHCQGILILVHIIFLDFYCLFFPLGCFLLLWGKEAIKKWMFLIKLVGFFFIFKVYTAAINWIAIKVPWKQNSCSYQ